MEQLSENNKQSCLQLALEGERYCQLGYFKKGIRSLCASLEVGTENLCLLRIIYRVVGNALVCVDQYQNSLMYYTHEMNLTRIIGDKVGEAAAHGSVGRVLYHLNFYANAIDHFQRQLDISRDLSSEMLTSRALHWLGVVHHKLGVRNSQSGALEKALDYFQQELDIVRRLAPMGNTHGRVLGNLANTFYMLGRFSDSVLYQNERLFLAKKIGDVSAECRAYANLANSYLKLDEHEKSINSFYCALAISAAIGDAALEARFCFDLSKVFWLIGDHHRAINFQSRYDQKIKECALESGNMDELHHDKTERCKTFEEQEFCLKNEVERQHVTITELHETIQRLENDLDERCKTIQQHEKRLDELNLMNQKLTDGLVTQTEMNDDFRQTVQDLKEQIKGLSISQQLAQTLKENSQLQLQVTEQKNEIDKLTAEINHLNEEINKLNQHLSVTTKAQKDFAEIEIQMRATRNELQMTRIKNAMLTTENISLHQSVTLLSKRLTNEEGISSCPTVNIVLKTPANGKVRLVSDNCHSPTSPQNRQRAQQPVHANNSGRPVAKQVCIGTEL